jgi:hypothetical protein
MRDVSAARIRLLAFVLVVTIGWPAAAASAKSPPITFYFGLKRPDPSAQRAFFAVSRPGSPTYRTSSASSRCLPGMGPGPR